MKTIIVDDEKWSMKAFVDSCENNSNFHVLGFFSDPFEALEFAKNNHVEFALLDIEMPGMNGIELGKKLREIYPEIVIIYVTAYFEEYAVEALKQKADFYVSKPYVAADIEEVLLRAHYLSARQKKPVFIRTFGFFDVFIDGQPLVFRSSKAKELLALLVDRNGGIVTTEEALAYVWEDKDHSDANLSLCRSAFSKLLKILEKAGIRDIVKVDGRGKMIDKTACDCDYFKMLDGDKKYIDSFADAYMTNYSWAEETAGLLYGIKHKNDNY